MKKISIKSTLILFIMCVFFACKKDNKNDDGDKNTPLVFSELIADNDTIIGGTSTTVTATASGYNIVYLWSVTAGDILGSGAVIQYAAPPCVTGSNQITCTVKDANNNALTKTISVYGM